MKITVNGTPTDVQGTNLAEILIELGHADGKLATAVNEEFVPAAARETLSLAPGDRVEIVAPRQGG
ncbi:sulfur carrier protein ThiS [Actibacterium sp.]|uniref:sulfur carrier protein ThiS n=1 Tax=Actibacterium sp. TaxID=1872125 RepID=UPI00356A6318